jgi:hypothetical protein
MIDFLDSDLRDVMAHSPFSRRDVVRGSGTDSEEALVGFLNVPVRENPAFSKIGASPQAATIAKDIAFTFQCPADRLPVKGEFFRIGDKDHEAHKVLHDGHGMVTVFMHER